MTATEMVPADVRALLDETVRQAESLEAAARTLTISNDTEAQLATEFVSRAARIKRDTEAQRVAKTKPLLDRKRALDEAFKAPIALLDEADSVVRQALLAYQTEQQRIRLEAERAAAEARRKAEAEAEAERRRLAEELARQQREAQEAERARVAALVDEQAVKVAAIDDDELSELAEAVDEQRDAALYAAVQAELAHREANRRIADEAQAVVDAAHLAELNAKTAVAPVTAPVGPSRSASGSAGLTKRWTGEVADPRAVVQAWLDGKVPAEFVTVNEAEVGKYIRAAKDQHEQHPGITYSQTAGLSVRTS